MDELLQAFETLRAVCAKRYASAGGLEEITLTFRNNNKKPIVWVFPDAPADCDSPAAASRNKDTFIPCPVQRKVLKALKGKILTSGQLQKLLKLEKRRLFDDPGGLQELKRHGLIRGSGRGYYRPDAPPPMDFDEDDIEDEELGDEIGDED